MTKKAMKSEIVWPSYALIFLALTAGSFIRIGQLNTDATDTTIRTPDDEGVKSFHDCTLSIG